MFKIFFPTPFYSFSLSLQLLLPKLTIWQNNCKKLFCHLHESHPAPKPPQSTASPQADWSQSQGRNKGSFSEVKVNFYLKLISFIPSNPRINHLESILYAIGLSEWHSFMTVHRKLKYFPQKGVLFLCVHTHIFVYICLHIFTHKMLMLSLKSKFENTLDRST